MMSMVYPESSVPFYEGVFELVNFDPIETEAFYDENFEFENEPYNEWTDSIGYPSQYLIFNSGSLTLFLWATILFQFVIFPLIERFCPKNNMFYRFVQRKRSDYFWAGFTDVLNDVAFSLSFCVGINLPTLAWQTASDIVNGVWTCVIGLTLMLWPIYMVF